MTTNYATCANCDDYLAASKGNHPTLCDGCALDGFALLDTAHLWLWATDAADRDNASDVRSLATLAHLLGGGFCEACGSFHPGPRHSRD